MTRGPGWRRGRGDLLLFIRRFLKSWNWMEVLSELMLPLAVFVLSHPPSPSSSAPVLSALFLLATP